MRWVRTSRSIASCKAGERDIRPTRARRAAGPQLRPASSRSTSAVPRDGPLRVGAGTAGRSASASDSAWSTKADGSATTLVTWAAISLSSASRGGAVDSCRASSAPGGSGYSQRSTAGGTRSPRRRIDEATTSSSAGRTTTRCVGSPKGPTAVRRSGARTGVQQSQGGPAPHGGPGRLDHCVPRGGVVQPRPDRDVGEAQGQQRVLPVRHARSDLFRHAVEALPYGYGEAAPMPPHPGRRRRQGDPTGALQPVVVADRVLEVERPRLVRGPAGRRGLLGLGEQVCGGHPERAADQLVADAAE